MKPEELDKCKKDAQGRPLVKFNGLGERSVLWTGENGVWFEDANSTNHAHLRPWSDFIPVLPTPEPVRVAVKIERGYAFACSTKEYRYGDVIGEKGWRVFDLDFESGTATRVEPTIDTQKLAEKIARDLYGSPHTAELERRFADLIHKHLSEGARNCPRYQEPSP